MAHSWMLREDEVKQLVLRQLRSLMLQRSYRVQRKGQLADLRLWGLGRNERGHICVGGTDSVELVQRYGSPLLAVNREQLQHDARAAQEAIGRCNNGSMVAYSYKTNCIPGILQELHAAGLGAEVISPYELWLAERLGVDPDRIIYNGVNKTEESLARAVEAGILAINIDCLAEIERVVRCARRLKRKARVGVRLAFSEQSQFGLDIGSGEAMEACRRICREEEWLALNMVHFSVASNAKEAGTHCHFAAEAVDFIRAIKEKTGRTIDFLNVGGGIGVPTSKNMSRTEYGLYRLFGCLPRPPVPEDFEGIDSFVRRIEIKVGAACAQYNLKIPGIIIEPGRFVTSRGEFLLSTVLSVKRKRDGTRYVITDAGRLSLTYPCDFEYHAIFPAVKTNGRAELPQNIMGRICTSADWMAKNALLPELQEGDLLATMDAGAYFSSYSSNFAFPRPAVVMVDATGSEKLLRKEESFEHLVGMDTVFP